MIELLKTPSNKTVGFRCSGRLHDEDYKKIQPKLEQTMKKEGSVRVLVQFDDFHGWDLHAALDELVMELKHAHEFEKIALIGNARWEKWIAKLPRLFTTAKVRFFDTSELEHAWEWLEDESFISYH